MLALMFSAPFPLGGIGSWMVSIIRWRCIHFPVRGRISNEPSIVTGTTSSCSSSANWKAPLLKYPMCPVKVRAPSGNTTSDTPSFKDDSACRMVASTFLGLERSTKICPALSHALPTNGILRRLFFIIHLKFRPRNPYIKNMSKAPW